MQLHQVDISREYTGDVRPRLELIGDQIVVDDEAHDERGVVAHLGRTTWSVDALSTYLSWLVSELQRITAAPARE